MNHSDDREFENTVKNLLKMPHKPHKPVKSERAEKGRSADQSPPDPNAARGDSGKMGE